MLTPLPALERREDPHRERRRAAALDELDQRVQVVRRVLRHRTRERARKARVDELLAAPREDLHASFVPARPRSLPPP